MPTGTAGRDVLWGKGCGAPGSALRLITAARGIQAWHEPWRLCVHRMCARQNCTLIHCAHTAHRATRPSCHRPCLMLFSLLLQGMVPGGQPAIPRYFPRPPSFLALFFPQTWCVVGNLFSGQKDHEAAIDFFLRAVQVRASGVATAHLPAASTHPVHANNRFSCARGSNRLRMPCAWQVSYKGSPVAFQGLAHAAKTVCLSASSLYRCRCCTTSSAALTFAGIFSVPLPQDAPCIPGGPHLYLFTGTLQFAHY